MTFLCLFMSREECNGHCSKMSQNVGTCRTTLQRGSTTPSLGLLVKARISYPFFQGEMISGQKAFFRGGGWVFFFEGVRDRNFIPPPFYTPPTPEGYFQGWGGGGCIKFGPALLDPATNPWKNSRVHSKHPRISWVSKDQERKFSRGSF